VDAATLSKQIRALQLSFVESSSQRLAWDRGRPESIHAGPAAAGEAVPFIEDLQPPLRLLTARNLRLKPIARAQDVGVRPARVVSNPVELGPAWAIASRRNSAAAMGSVA